MEIGDDVVQVADVGAFAAHVLRRQTHAQRSVHRVAMRQRDFDVAPPARGRLGVAVLQGHHHVPRPLRERRVGFEPPVGLHVEALQVVESLRVFADVVEMRHQTPEAGAPVANVVLPDRRMAQRFQDARHRIANDRAAQVVNLHLFGQIRMRVVDDDALRSRRWRDVSIGDGAGEPIVRYRQADEAGAGHRARCRDVVQRRRIDHPLRQRARILAQALGGGHDAVRLVVAERRPRRRRHQRRRAGSAGGSESGLQALRQQALEIQQGTTSSACQPRRRLAATKQIDWPSVNTGRSSPRWRIERKWTKISLPSERTTKP